MPGQGTLNGPPFLLNISTPALIPRSPLMFNAPWLPSLFLSSPKRKSRRRQRLGLSKHTHPCVTCIVSGEALEERLVLSATVGNNIAVGDEFQNYRIAIAATAEFTAYFGDQNAALAAIQDTVAELNEIFERELAIHFDLVSGTNTIFTNSSTDGYTNGNASTMIGQNTPILNSIIGVGNYDIGHVFGTVSSGGSGLAGLGVVNNSNWKGRGVSLFAAPVGTNFVNLVAHEIGHQFNAEHTFNGNTYGSTAGNRSASSAYEPASGSTLMSYAGIAADGSGNDNLQDQEDDYFHSASFEEIQTFLAGSGAPSSTTPTGNSIPTISAGSDYTIPAGTTFQLIASGSDADSSDTLTYTWEQLDLGPAMSLPLFDNGSSPLFRSFVPTTDPSRTFPLLDDIINNVNTAAIGEALPTTDRDINFRATVRDGNGGVNSDDTLITVVDTGSPFQLTNTNSGSTWIGGQSQTITWDVAGTTANGINAANVAIELSDDGGYTYGITLAASTANDGSFTIDVPNIDIDQARVRVRAIGNVFFDISDADFSITSNASLPGVTVTESGGTTLIGEAGVVGGQTVDTYTLALNTTPSGPVDITVNADSQTEVSLDGVNFASSVVVTRSDTTPQTIHVRGFDDGVEEGIHNGSITHSVSSSSDSNYPLDMDINSISVTIADDELQPLIGVDFDDTGSSPTNWTTITSIFSSSNSNLIREDGATSSVDLTINTSGGANTDTTSPPPNLPDHSPTLSGLDGIRFAANSIVLTWSDLVPLADYDLYLFLSEPYSNIAIQTVTISGGGNNPFPFIMDTSQTGSDLLVNSAVASPSRPLEDDAVRATADSSGEIVITISNTGGDYVFLSGAAIQAVAPVGTPPQAVNDSYSIDEDTTLNVSAAGVLSNDTDTELDPLTASLLTGPTNGSLTLNPDGSFTYTPNENFNGTDTFTYLANDGSYDSNTATVTITVNATNDEPVAQDDPVTTDEDTPITVSVLDNDSDVDGDTISVLSVSDPSNGTAVLNVDDTVTYTPNQDFHGEDTFTYTITDTNNETHTATVTVTVDPINDEPVAADDSASTDEDTAVDISVLTNDSDIDGDKLTVQSASTPTNGTTVVNANGTITYTPNANFNGKDEFTYTISDGNGGSHSATVTVTVLALNDAPVATDDGYSVDEDGTLTVPAAGVLGNDTDVEDDSLNSILVSDTANGTLTLNTDGSFTYTPDADFNGTDTFTYKANDGSADSDPATVTITVNPINDAPVATDDSTSTNEDTPVTIDLLANDTDTESDSLSVEIDTGPTNGSVEQNPDKTVTYTPDPDFHGTDTFTYLVTDGDKSDTATVTVTVLPINDAPIAVDDSATTTEDVSVTISVLDNDSDVDGDSPTVASVSDPANGSVVINQDGTVTYTPDTNFEGSDTFTYTIDDGHGEMDTATVTVTIGAVNDPPVASDDSASTDEDTSVDITVLDNDSDIDGDVLSVVSASEPANGTTVVNANGTITYTPDPDFHGTDTFTYKIDDGNSGSDTATVTVTVNPTADVPEAADDDYSVDEDTTLTISAAGVLGNDSDVDGDSLTAAVVAGPSHGSLTLNSDGSFSYTPNTNFNGSDSFTYQANDGTANSNTATVTIVVNAVNDRPEAADDDSYSVDEDNSLTVPAAGVLGNDSDIDGNGFTAVLVDGPDNGDLTLNSDGSFTYTPDAHFNGSDTFTYLANDGIADSDPATVTITVNPINDDPEASDDSPTTDEDTAVDIAVLDNDTDIDGDILTVISASDPTNGSVVVNANGTITYTPDTNFHGSDSFTYTIQDTSGQPNTAMVNITVNPLNDPPVALDDSAQTDEGVPVVITVLDNDSDVDGDQPSVTSASDPASGTTQVNPDGTITYTPDVDFHGSDSFTYNIADGNGGNATGTVSVTVSATQNDSVVSLSLAALDGGVSNASPPTFGEGPTVLHEWQTVGGHLWLTIDEAFEASSLDLVIDIGSSTELVESPVIIEHVGQAAQIESDVVNTDRATRITLTGIDLSGVQIGDHVYLGTLAFSPNTSNLAGLTSGTDGEYSQGEDNLGFSVNAAETVGGVPLLFASEVPGSIAPVIYDTNDDGRIGLSDFAEFISLYGHTADQSKPEAYRYDFDRNGKVSLQDFALFIRYYGFTKVSQSDIEMPGLTSELVTQAATSQPAEESIGVFAAAQLESESNEITLIDQGSEFPAQLSVSSPQVTNSTLVPESRHDTEKSFIEENSESTVQRTIRVDHLPHARLFSNVSWEPRLVDVAVQDDDVFDFSSRAVESDDDDEFAFAPIWPID